MRFVGLPTRTRKVPSKQLARTVTTTDATSSELRNCTFGFGVAYTAEVRRLWALLSATHPPT